MMDTAVLITSGMARRSLRVYRTAWERRNRTALLAFMLPVMIIAKLMVAFFLPPKYFYDNNRILCMTNVTLGMADPSTVQEWEGSYRVASDLFAALNVMRLETMLDWSLCLGVIFTAVIAVMVMYADLPDLLQSVFILATVGLLNIYVFTIGKDVIQFMFFFAVYVVLMLPLGHPTLKILLSALILYFESTFFRAYYILIAALIVAVYAVLSFFKKRKTITPSTVALIIVMLFAGIYVVMLVAQRVMPDEYNQILGLREGYEIAFGGSIDSVTRIQNLISGDGLPIFMVNYVINALRMMIPIELALRGVYYWPFFIFQIMVTLYLVNVLRKITTLNESVVFLALCVFIGYALVSFLFEPDFGSWTRHEAATFPVLHVLVLNRYQRISLSRREKISEKAWNNA